MDRARAVWCVEALLDRIDPAERYFPDVSPEHWAYSQLTAAAATGTLEQDALMAQTLAGFLWFDGYLYRLDEEGYFVVGQTADGLTYDENGRYTSGNAQLDDLVAQTLLPMLEQGKTRQDLLRAVYLHVKNDFQYLVRNYYDNGENGWEISEALTMFETGKGNCYNYASAFAYIALWLGYEAKVCTGTVTSSLGGRRSNVQKHQERTVCGRLCPQEGRSGHQGRQQERGHQDLVSPFRHSA